MHGRQWSDGLHQAVEAKEGVTVKEETQTLATITLQNFFKLYKQIAGMTGTAMTEADEFMKIYKLDVVVIPTNQPCIRDDQRGRDLQDEAGEVRRHRRGDQSHQRRGPAGAGRHDQHREERGALRRADETLRHRARGAQRQAARPRSRDRRQGRPAVPGPGRQDARQRHHRDEHGRPRHRHQARAGRRRDRRPAHPRHRAARGPPHRQPAARPFRPAGRRRVQPVLSVLRRRPDAGLRRRVDGQGPLLDRLGGRRAHLPQADQQGHRQGPEEGRGAQLRDPQEPARLRRGDGLPAEDLLLAATRSAGRQERQADDPGDDRGDDHRSRPRRCSTGIIRCGAWWSGPGPTSTWI